MQITEITPQKKNPSRMNLFIDGKFFCGVSVNSLAKYNIYPKKDITEDELNNILFFELKERFLTRCVEYLGKYPKSEKDLRKYINTLAFKKKKIWYEELSKEDLQGITETIVEKLKEYEYLNDERYAEQFIASRLRSRPRSKMVLLNELYAKGIDREIAERKVSEMIEDEYEVLVRTYRKKYKEEKITFEEKKKISFLQRKGYSWDLIEQFINNELGK